MDMRLLLLRQENLSEEMERGLLRFPWTNICMLCADTVHPECDKTETLQGNARICQDSLHSSQRDVSGTNSINQLNHLKMSYINDIINNINDQFSFEGIFITVSRTALLKSLPLHLLV